MYLVCGGCEGKGNKCIYLHQHSIKKIKQHVSRGGGEETLWGKLKTVVSVSVKSHFAST